MATAKRDRKGGDAKRVRWAVVGLGYFAQAAVLPAFAHARQTCKLVALFSDDARKRRRLGKQYRVQQALPYERYDDTWRAARSMRSISPCPTTCTRSTRCARPGPASTCCAKSRWP